MPLLRSREVTLLSGTADLPRERYERLLILLSRRQGVSTERERKHLHARIEKLDLDKSISDGLQLSDQLIQALFGNRAVALVVGVNAVSSARRLSVDEHPKTYGSSTRRRSHDEVEVAGVKAEDDPPVSLVQPRGLFPDRPITGKRPFIEPQSGGDGVDAGRVRRRPTGRREVLGAVIAEIILPRLQVVPIGGSLDTTSIDRNQLVTDATDSGLGQQLLNHPLRLFVFSLAEGMMSNVPLPIDEIEGRPILVVETPPYRIVVIDRDRIIHPHVLHGSGNVPDVLLKCELRRVHADRDQSLIPVFRRPRADIGQGA